MLTGVSVNKGLLSPESLERFPFSFWSALCENDRSVIMAAFYSCTKKGTSHFVGPEDDITTAQDKVEKNRNAKTNHI